MAKSKNVAVETNQDELLDDTFVETSQDEISQDEISQDEISQDEISQDEISQDENLGFQVEADIPEKDVKHGRYKVLRNFSLLINNNYVKQYVVGQIADTTTWEKQNQTTLKTLIRDGVLEKA